MATSLRARLLWIVPAALIFVWCGVLAAGFPDAEAYRFAADEGTYLRQAGLVADEGLGAFRTLAERYVATSSEHTAPPPFRVAHLLVAALVLKAGQGMVALSWLALACHGLTCGVVLWLARGLWGARFAALASLLVLGSPLASGMAQRALADTHLTLASTLCLLACAHHRRGQAPWARWLFLGALGYTLLLKETAYLFVPFYALAMLRGAAGERRRALVDGALVALAVPCASLGLSAMLVGGPALLWRAMAAALARNASAPHAYLSAYGSGPWYEYALDAILLSPVAALLALGFVGQLALRRGGGDAERLLLGFALYLLTVLAFLPKNPRFALPLEPVLRLGAAGMLCALIDAWWSAPRARVGATLAGLAVLLALDVHSHRLYFVTSAIYDPIAYNLLGAARMIPVPTQPPPPRPADQLSELTARAAKEGTPDAYLALSLAHYAQKHYREAEAASRSAIALRSDFAPAYNNLGLALAGTARWAEAVTAFRVALTLQPGFQLARNNLAWVEAEAARARSRGP